MDTSPEAVARQFYAKQVLEALAGKQVRLKVDIERDTFIVPAGSTGIAQDPFLVDGLLVAAIKLDDPPPEAKDFDGELHWMEDINLIDFEDEVELA